MSISRSVRCCYGMLRNSSHALIEILSTGKGLMQYEFRGHTLQEAVSKVTGRYECKNNNRCDRLQYELERRQEAIAQRENRVARLERSIQSLSDEIENDKEGFDQDDVNTALGVAVALASLIPAVRAVRVGIGAVRAGMTIAQAIRNGNTISQGVQTAIGGLLGISLLSTPGPRRQMQRLLAEVEDEMENIERLNRSVSNVLDEMERNGCNSRQMV